VANQALAIGDFGADILFERARLGRQIDFHWSGEKLKAQDKHQLSQ
jgi:hypothetical protein